ncbi:hypothetical protein KUTeg_021160 [Tegillarca granosa]|uniref:B30.2/SPRY domain-containing protein n=1 Tax=Tegillarca granosa TaxID=220873 RepID=A0ABQ9EFZ0_TEGGR|nr:hypothetical protein KUTeg_021160 [Tegillarca granosa]
MFDVKSNVGTLVMEPDKLGGTSLSNFSTIRANCCVYKGKWVYELMLGSKGVMQLGWCTINCKFSVEEGVGDTPDSYAYDGSRLRKWNVKTQKYGESWLTGDVISCALDCDNGTVTFYRNGKSMGQAFSTVRTGQGFAYFPAISLSQQENLRANFGATPLRYPIYGYRPLQDSPHTEVLKAQVLFSYLRDLLPVIAENKKTEEADILPDRKGNPVPPSPLGVCRTKQSTLLLVASHLFDKLAPLLRGAYIVEACLMKFLLELTDADISEVLNLMWSLMQEFEIKPCLENLIISILSSYRFSPVTTDFKFPKMYLSLALSILRHQQTRRYLLSHILFDKIKFPTFMHIKPPDDTGLAELIQTVWWDKNSKKDDKPAELETPEEKSQKESYITACDQLRKKIEELEQIQVEMLKVLLLHNDVSIDIIHVNTCPLPVMLCFFHRMIQALRFYWDDFRKEDISRFVLSQDAFMPIHEFWAETRDYFEFQRCGGLLSHINRMLGGEVNKAQGLTVKQDGEVVSIDSTKQKVQNKDAYPEIEMPSGNSLMELLDGIIILYHTGAHKQLAKMSTLRDNLKEYSSSLQDAETKLNNCPPEPKQEDVAWVLKVTLKTIQKASHFRLLFQYTPEFYIETVINSYNALKNYFHPSVTFNSLQDVRDNIVQALACFICFPSSLKTLEELPMENKLSMIRSLIGPYENRSWAQTNWILVRIWKGCGFGFRYTHLPHLIPSKVQPTEFGFASLQKPCPSRVFQSLLRQVLLEDGEASTRFLDTVLSQLNWTFSEFIGMMQEIQQKVARTELRILEGRQLKICATCFEIAVYLMRVLEMVISLVPELFLDFSRDSAELLLGRLTQLLCQVLNRITTKSGMFDNVVSIQKKALQFLLSDPGFQISSLEFFLGTQGPKSASPKLTPETAKRPFSKKDKIFDLQTFEEVSEEEVDNIKNLIGLLKEKQQAFIHKSEEFKEEDLCTICYANPKSVEFVPCGHQSCR